jgi:Tfp pilus assembly protein PilF
MVPRLRRLIDDAASLPWGVWHVLGLLAGIVALRNVLEIAVAQNPAYAPIAALVHYPLAYVGPFLALTLVLALGAGWMPGRVARLMGWAWLLTLLPPLADLVLHPGREAPAIAYLDADPVDLPWVWLHFFDPTVVLRGTTPGIRIEAAAAVILAAVFVYVLTRRVWRALATAAAVYVVSLTFFSLPVLVRASLTWIFPGLTRQAFLSGEGWLPRPHPDIAPDATAVLWLVPVCAGIGLVWWWAERRHGETGWLHGRLGLPGEPSLAGPLQPLLLCGALAGSLLLLPEERLPALAPFDLLALVGAGVSLALLVAGARRAVPAQTRSGGLLLLLLGTAGACGLGAPVTYCMLSVAGALVVVSLPMPGPAWRVSARIVGITVAACGTMLAGFALATGKHAFARFPVTLTVIPALAAAFLVVGLDGPERWRRWLLPGGVGFGLLAGVLVTGRVALVPPGLLLAVGGGLVALFLAKGGPGSVRRAPWVGLTLAALLTGMFALGSGAREDLASRVQCVPRIEFLRGQQLEAEGFWESARIAYRNALECDPEYTPALRELGLGILQYDGKPELAERRLRRALETNPGSAQELNNLAAAHMEQGEWGEALELLNEAVGVQPRHLEARFNHARVLQELGRREEALAAWRRYVELARGRPEHREDLRRARRQMRRLR